MKLKNPPLALTSESLLSKSKVYIARAFRAKTSGDAEEYQLWASLALELLGKAALARIHPCLVADPMHADSLFAASGIQLGSDIKTITAKTLFLRLKHLSKYFDKNVHDFCEQQSLRRNAELHSGEAPFLQMRAEAWESKYWHAAQIILKILNLSLEEWLGANNAKAPKERVRQAEEAAVQAATQRVIQAKDHFGQRPKKEREHILKESRTKEWHHYPSLFRLMADHNWRVDCPACGGRAFLTGYSYEEEVLEPRSDTDEEEVEVFYGAEELQCPVCDLHLATRAEIEAVGLEADHSEIESREREFEPEYGNC